MTLKIGKPYIWLPVSKNAPETKLHFFIEGKKVQEIDIHLCKTDCEFYGCWDASAFVGKEIQIEGADKELLEGIFCYEKPYENVYPYRPKLHFAPVTGWHNDPNGMIYADGFYHLYYQWNPYGTGWGNMHWGHVKSKDMYHWEQEGMAMAPDEKGTVYSGCAIQDKDNLTGCGKDALLFYYTAAGGRNQWSEDAGNLFTQRLAFSVDGGKTLQRSEKFCLPHIVNENRDPKIFYHKESQAFIMVLYLDGYDFAIYRSEDLLNWEETQRISEPGMWECPDLFELEVKNVPGEKKWVFWSADGYYMIGKFDGYTFKVESTRRSAYSSVLPYAAQSFSGVDGRVVSMAWLRMKNDRGNYRGLMSLPTELSLEKEGNEYKICFAPAKELENLETEWYDNLKDTICPAGEACRIVLNPEAGTKGEWRLTIGKLRLTADFYSGILSIEDTEAHVYYMKEKISAEQEISFIFDQEVIEVFAENGKVYGTAETEENILGMDWELFRTEELKISEKMCRYK